MSAHIVALGASDAAPERRMYQLAEGVAGRRESFLNWHASQRNRLTRRT